MNPSVLYITYDGLLDPLGGSQILPYVYGMAAHPRKVHILSFEKPARFKQAAEPLRRELTRRGIDWTPLSFTRRCGTLGKVWDLGKMYGTALVLQQKNRFGILHCRNHQAMQVGSLLRSLTGVQILFDVRGLWVDERVDKGGWELSHRLDRLQYNYCKHQERSSLRAADAIVALTEAVVPELIRLGVRDPATITVIPTCADYQHFPCPSLEQRSASKAAHGFSPDAIVLGYLGSIGRMYMTEIYMILFRYAATQRGDVHGLVVTPNTEAARELASSILPEALLPRLVIRQASREEVPHCLHAMDINTCFIRPSYARMAASPTKLGEGFACGLPVIANGDVGDVADHVERLRAGILIDPTSDEAIRDVAGRLDEVKQLGGQGLRERTRKVFGLEVAYEKHRKVYESLK